MATITHDELWLCTDCHMAASGVDTTILDQEQAKATEDGLARLAEDGHLVPNGNGETGDGCDVLMSARCGCCNVLHVHGLHNRYVVLGEDPKPTYLDPARVTAKRQTTPPPNRSRTGYGSKLPTSWELKLDDKRWRRVYVMQWSNAGTAYVLVGGKPHLLGSYDPALDAHPAQEAK